MPRRSRIDAPGALHHIIVRGIERKTIFKDDADRDNFLERLQNILTDSNTSCFAWALIPNHFHLLLRTGRVPISTVMKRLLTGHAMYFNRKHNRVGHLFQNRYKSILCQEDVYALELIRYECNGVKSTIDPWKIRCYILQHVTSTYNRISRSMVSCDEPWETVRIHFFR